MHVIAEILYILSLVIAMAISVGDRVVCNADKVMGNKPAKQRYGRLFRKELQARSCSGNRGLACVTRSMWFACFDEVTTTKAFSDRSQEKFAVNH